MNNHIKIKVISYKMKQLYFFDNRDENDYNNLYKNKVERWNSMKKLTEFKDVDWRRSYPNYLENEQLLLKRKNWGFRLIYDVYLKQEETHVFLGSCIIKEVDNLTSHKGKTTKYVVKELAAKSPLLRKRLKDIDTCICKNL